MRNEGAMFRWERIRNTIANFIGRRCMLGLWPSVWRKKDESHPENPSFVVKGKKPIFCESKQRRVIENLKSIVWGVSDDFLLKHGGFFGTARASTG